MGAGPPISSLQQTELDEEAEAEKSRKMQMAAGLFAGVIPSAAAPTQGKQIMQYGNSSNVSALDDLIPISNSGNSSSVFDTTTSSSDPFGMGAMGGSSSGNGGSSVGMPPPPPMAPPPMAPPPPPMVPVEPPPMPPPPPPSASRSLRECPPSSLERP